MRPAFAVQVIDCERESRRNYEASAKKHNAGHIFWILFAILRVSAFSSVYSHSRAPIALARRVGSMWLMLICQGRCLLRSDAFAFAGEFDLVGR